MQSVHGDGDRTSDLPTFAYEGQRAPRLVRAIFNARGSHVRIVFDGVPTDMGGAGGALALAGSGDDGKEGWDLMIAYAPRGFGVFK